MMPELSARTFLPVALATGTATFIGRIFFGIHPAFAMPSTLLTSQAPASLDALLLYALLGALIGIAAAGFIRGLRPRTFSTAFAIPTCATSSAC